MVCEQTLTQQLNEACKEPLVGGWGLDTQKGLVSRQWWSLWRLEWAWCSQCWERQFEQQVYHRCRFWTPVSPTVLHPVLNFLFNSNWGFLPSFLPTAEFTAAVISSWSRPVVCQSALFLSSSLASSISSHGVPPMTYTYFLLVCVAADRSR